MRKGLKVVASIEGLKGLVSLILSVELHRIANGNHSDIGGDLSADMDLKPAGKLSGFLYQQLHSLTNSSLSILSAAAFAYSIIRLIEAYGLWHELEWVEWFALISGSIYIPFEIYEIFMKQSLVSLIALLINVSIVGYLYSVIRSNHRKQPSKKTS